MKIWVGTSDKRYVLIFPVKPSAESWDSIRKWWYDYSWKERPSTQLPIAVCRAVIARLLRGTGKKLPKPDTNELVEVELFVK